MSPARKSPSHAAGREVLIDAGGFSLAGTLGLPDNPCGIVLFAHGSGSSRLSPRNRLVARALESRGIATLLFDLLTLEEEDVDQRTAQLRFNIPLLAERLVAATLWVGRQPALQSLPLGYFGASTGAAAALVAAARLPETVSCVVSRGGRPDLAGNSLRSVRAPTLCIVGAHDEEVLQLNREALDRLGAAEKKLVLIPGATHLFEEPGTLEQAAEAAASWFIRNLKDAHPAPSVESSPLSAL